MRIITGYRGWKTAIVVGASLMLSGCMVGPDYQTPPAPVAPKYSDLGSEAVVHTGESPANWWMTFDDPVLNQLVDTAYRQNPTLRSAAVRVLEAEARRGIAVGLLFPQDQAAFGSYSRNQVSRNQPELPANASRTFNEWQLGGAVSWELDIWGRFRRGIESADADVLASVATYDDVLVTLIGNVASEYVSIRILQERLAVAEANVVVQKRGLDIATTKFKGGTATELDPLQATTLLRNTESLIPELKSALVQSADRLCLLLGIPPKDLRDMLGEKQVIPATSVSVVVGIPADLLRRRPDIRRAERDLASQSARIGIAKSDLFPRLSLVGDIRLVSESFGTLFSSESVQAFAGPTFRWDLFNYGRIENNVRVEDARFQALIGVYEDTVLRAQAEVQDSIAGYLGAQQQVILIRESVAASERAVAVAETQYRGGIADYTRVLITQQSLQNEQDRLISLRGAVVLNLVGLYRALGGGWELREGRVQIDEKILAQMRQRTNWGKLLPPSGEAPPRQNGNSPTTGK